MVPETFETFFLATAGAGAGLIGLLFVAISIHPQRTFDLLAIRGASVQGLAEATLLVLLNGFIVSSIALVPGLNVGWIALLFGAGGAYIAATVSRRVAGLHRHSALRRRAWGHKLHVMLLGLISTVLYLIQSVLALQLLVEPRGQNPIRGLAVVVVGLYFVGIVRAWTLLGDPQQGWSGWLNPLQDLVVPGEPDTLQEDFVAAQDRQVHRQDQMPGMRYDPASP